MELQKLLGFFGKKDKDDVLVTSGTASFEDSYRHWLIEQCTHLTDLPIGPVNSFAKLNELYCQSQLQAFNFLNIDKDMSLHSSSLTEAMAQNRHLLLIAPSGFGKTTLCRFLALKAASFKSDFEDETLAIYLPLKILNHTQQTDIFEADTSLETILKLALPEAMATSNKAQKLLGEKLKAGQCLILFDGLDDIVDDDVRKQWFESIADFANKYSNNYIVLTSDYHSLESCIDLKDKHSFTSYKLMPFSDSEIERYVLKHFNFLNNSLAIDTALQPEDFIEQVQANLRLSRLCRNPMMLCMMVALYTDKVALESEQGALFNSYLKQSLLWYTPQGCHPSQWQFALERLAYTMHKNSTPFIFGNWCKKVLMTEFDSLDLPLTPDELDALLSSCRSEHGVFRDINSKAQELNRNYQNHIFEFSHKSFQNFFTAKQLHYKAYEGLETIKSEGLRTWDQGEQSVLMFYAMLAKETVVKADELMNWLLTLKDRNQEALFCASDIALYSDTVSNIIIERIQDNLQSIKTIENDYFRTRAEVSLANLAEKYSISKDVILTHG